MLHDSLASALLSFLLCTAAALLVCARKRTALSYRPLFLAALASIPCTAVFFICSSPHSIRWSLEYFLFLSNAFLADSCGFIVLMQLYKHVDRSITLGILSMLLDAPDRILNFTAMERLFCIEEMIDLRMKHLQKQGYVKFENDRWQPTEKGKRFTSVMRLLLFVFQAKTQCERN